MDGIHLTPGAPRGPRPGSRGTTTSHESINFAHRPGPPSVMAQTLEHHRAPRKLVLCFDGTGNKFRGDDSDSNILKIFRCLDREAGDQCRSCFTAMSHSHDVILSLLSRSLLPARHWHVYRIDFVITHQSGSSDSVMVSEGEGFRDWI